MILQKNCQPEGFVDKRFYEVGRKLRFVAYNDMAATMPDWEIEENKGKPPGYKFEPGDILRVSYRNGCGMGIDVIRMSDGLPDMVWPEEVTLT